MISAFRWRVLYPARFWLARRHPDLFTFLWCWGLVKNEDPWEVVHQCPPDGAQLTPCCQQSPFDLSRHDRMTNRAELVNCRGF